MKPILILQFRTDISQDHELKYILKFSGIDRHHAQVINVLEKNSPIPKPEDINKYSAIITGASAQFNITDWDRDIQNRVKAITPFFKKAVDADKPLLAICFGHQLIAHLFGGKVATDPTQAETGTFPVTLTKAGTKSPLFKNCPNQFNVILGHKDSVTKLPVGAQLLASSHNCKLQSYQLGKNVYSVQFHPELNLDGLIWRLKKYPEYLKNKSLSDLKNQFNSVPHAKKVLHNFISYYIERG